MVQEVGQPIRVGMVIRTTQPNWDKRREWSKEGWEERQWNVEGIVLKRLTAHGECYILQHPDGSIGLYDPSELETAVVINAS